MRCFYKKLKGLFKCVTMYIGRNKMALSSKTNVVENLRIFYHIIFIIYLFAKNSGTREKIKIKIITT